MVDKKRERETGGCFPNRAIWLHSGGKGVTEGKSSQRPHPRHSELYLKERGGNVDILQDRHIGSKKRRESLPAPGRKNRHSSPPKGDARSKEKKTRRGRVFPEKKRREQATRNHAVASMEREGRARRITTPMQKKRSCGGKKKKKKFQKRQDKRKATSVSAGGGERISAEKGGKKKTFCQKLLTATDGRKGGGEVQRPSCETTGGKKRRAGKEDCNSSGKKNLVMVKEAKPLNSQWGPADGGSFRPNSRGNTTFYFPGGKNRHGDPAIGGKHKTKKGGEMPASFMKVPGMKGKGGDATREEKPTTAKRESLARGLKEKSLNGGSVIIEEKKAARPRKGLSLRRESVLGRRFKKRGGAYC